MRNETVSLTVSQRSIIATLLPIVLGVFVAYLVIGFALPVIPLHVHEDLKLITGNKK